MHMSVGLASLYFGSGPFAFFALYNKSALERANQNASMHAGWALEKIVGDSELSAVAPHLRRAVRQ